jgi:hypothetical protein
LQISGNSLARQLGNRSPILDGMVAQRQLLVAGQSNGPECTGGAAVRVRDETLRSHAGVPATLTRFKIAGRAAVCHQDASGSTGSPRIMNWPSSWM